MSNPFDQFDASGGNPFDSFDEPSAPEATTTMGALAEDAKKPPLWETKVRLGDQDVPVRGVYDQDAKAYLVGNPNGQAFYINRNNDGSLGLKPYTGKPSAAGTSGENFAAGAGKAAVDTKRGIQQLGTLAGNTLGLVDDATVDQSFADAGAVKQRDADLMDTGAGVAGNFAGNVGTAMLGGGLIKGAGQGLGAIGKAAATTAPSTATAVSATGGALSKIGSAALAPKTYKQAAAAGAAYGAFSAPAESLEEKALQVGVGAVGGAAGQGIAKGVERVAKGASDVVRQEVKDLAKAAKDKWGIDIRNDQLLQSPKLNAVSTVLEETPLTGAAAGKANQQKQFNVALAKTLGETSDNPAYALTQAKKRLSKEFEDTLSKTRVLVDDEFVTAMEGVVRQANKNLKDSEAKIIRNQVDDILKKVGDDGRVEGQALYNIRKDLRQIADRNSNEAIHASDLEKGLLEALNRSLGPEEAAKFATTRRQYKNYLDLSKLRNRDAGADISPARLGTFRGELTGELEELAAIAQTFLRPRVGNSGTAARIKADTNILNLPVRVGEAVGGATVGRLANKALESPAAGKWVLEGSRNAKRVLPIGRAAPVALPAFLESYLSSQ